MRILPLLADGCHKALLLAWLSAFQADHSSIVQGCLVVRGAAAATLTVPRLHCTAASLMKTHTCKALVDDHVVFSLGEACKTSICVHS
jgi:hypothetical protein